MYNADEDKLHAVDHKFELSEEHRVLDDVKDIVEMGSFLREHVTNVTLSRESNSDFEQNSQVAFIPDYSNEESSLADVSSAEMFDQTNEESETIGTSKSVLLSREGLRKQKKTLACTMPSSYRQRKSDD